MKRIIVSGYGLLAIALTACGGSEGGRSIDGQQTRNAAVQSRGNIANPPPADPGSKSKSAAAVDGMNSSIGSDWDKIQAAQADKDRVAKSAERELDRKHEAAMEDKRINDRKEGRFMTTLKELMQMQMLGGMIHPDKCVNKGFIAGLKSTAQGLREAMSTTDAAKEKTITSAPAPSASPAGSAAAPSDVNLNLPKPAITTGPAVEPPKETVASAAPTPTPAPTPAPQAAAPAEAPVMGPPVPDSLAAAAKQLAPIIYTDVTTEQ